MFDLIGDVHGCADELDELLVRLGYLWDSDYGIFAHPGGRQAVFVGDLVDRGPDSPSVLQLVMNMVNEGEALMVLGNHDDKLRRALIGRKVTLTHGIDKTLRQLEERGNTFCGKVIDFLARQPWKLILHDSRLLVAHAGLAEKYQEREDDAARAKALYGETDGTKDANGYPTRIDWSGKYKGRRIVVHGHIPVMEPTVNNNVWNIDTGCCFGGHLTALRYPEFQLVQVEANEAYWPHKDPAFLPA
jgi:diadenosine tetraphosphatase ApaH/serine/threonine PP2A family protein phosphatase